MTNTCSQCGNTATTQCAHCHVALCADHAIAAEPLITLRQLASATVTTAVRAPGMLGEVLFKELGKVDYCSDCRQEVASLRQTEQLKLMGVLLVVLLVAIGLPVFAFLV